MACSFARRNGARILVWAALVLTIAATAAAQSSPTEGASLPSGVRAQMLYDLERFSEYAAHQTQVDGTSPGAHAAAGVLLEVPDRYFDASGSGAYASSDTSLRADPDELPAWRWRSMDLDMDDSGFFGALKTIPAVIAEVFFRISNLIWLLLLTTIKFGLGGEALIRMAAAPMNSAFAFVGQRLNVLLPLFVAASLWKLIGPFLRGQGPKALRSGIVFVASMVLLTGMSAQALNAANAGDTEGTRFPGTPSWIAIKTLGLSSKAIEPLTSSVVKVGGRDTNLTEVLKNQVCQSNPDSPECSKAVANDGIDCSAYIGVIEREYLAAEGSEPTLVVMSRLWQNTYMESWTVAAFGLPGPNNYPNEAICHWAEEKRGTLVADRWSIAQKSTEGTGAFPGTVPYFIFGPHEGDAPDLRKAMTGFAACSFVGDSWTTSPGWRGLDDRDDKIDKACSNAYSTQGNVAQNDDPPKFGELEFFGKRVNEWTRAGNVDGSFNEVRSFGLGFTGSNSGDRITQGILSLAVAIAFIMTLGFVGIGLFVSSLMAVVGLVLALPLAILAFAFESRRAKSLMRMVIASLMSKAIFTLILSTLIIISGLFQALISAAYSMPYFIRSIGYGVAPVLAMLILKKLLASIGMADIFSPTGAMSFATTAAMKASGNRTVTQAGSVGKDGLNPLQRGLRKSRSLQRLDRAGASRKNWNREGREARREANAQDKERKNDNRDAFRKKLDSYRDKLSSSGVRGMLRPVSRTKSGLRKAGTAAGSAFKDPWQRLITLSSLVGAGAATAIPRRRGAARTRRTNVDHDTADTSKEYTVPKMISGKGAKQARDEHIRDHDDMLKREYKEAAANIRKANPNIGDSELREQANQYVYSNLAARTSERLLGEMGPFTQAEVDGIRISAGTKLGYNPDDMVVSANGLVQPDPLSREAARTQLTSDQLRHPAHWLPEQDRERQSISENGQKRLENDNEYAARLHGMLLARGMVDDRGNQVDFLAVNGLDMNDPNVRARVEKWQKGMRDQLLDSLTVDSVDSAKERKIVAGLQADAVFSAQVAENTLSTQWQSQQQATAASVQQLPEANEKTQESIREVVESIQIIETTREMVQAAKDSGDQDVLEGAAARLNRAVELLEERASDIADQLEDMTVRCAEAAGVAVATAVGDVVAVEEKIEEHLSQLPDQIKQLSQVLAGVQSGAFSAEDATRFLEDLGRTVGKAMEKATRDFAKVMTEASEDQRLRWTEPKPQNNRSARTVGDGAGAFPDS